MEGLQLGASLGSGSYASVYVGSAESGELVAVKCMDVRKVAEHATHIKREVKALKKLVHPYVIRFRKVYLDGHKLFLCVEMECADGGNLLDAARRGLTEDQARWFFQQLMIAVDFCHEKGVAHRDIKLENILVTQNPDNPDWPFIKIADFGMTTDKLTTRLTTRGTGSRLYNAPELLTPVPCSNSRKTDVWSCGVTLYCLLTGNFPFSHPSEEPTNAQLLELMHKELAFPETLSEECQKLVRKMLKIKPDERITVQEILKDEWFEIGLSPGALDVNKVYLALPEPPGLQSDTEIDQIVNAAVGAARQQELRARARANVVVQRR